MTSYGLHNGNVTLEDGPVADNQAAPCWVVITGNGSFAYTANAGSSSISGYSLTPTGTLALLGSTGTGTSPNEIVLKYPDIRNYLPDARVPVYQTT